MSEKKSEQKKADLDNHANQLNPNNPEYRHSRGEKQPDPAPAKSSKK